MNRIIAITWKDLRSTMRNMPALAMMLLAPLVLAALLGFAFGGGEGFSISATPIVVADADEGTSGPAGGPARHAAGPLVVGVLRSPALADVLEVNEAASHTQARRQVDDGDAAVAVLIPSDLSAVVYGESTTARTTVELYEDPTQEIGSGITESVVSQALMAFNGARAAAAAAAELALADEQAGNAEAVAGEAAERYLQGEGSAAGVGLEQRPPRLPGGETSKDVGVTGVILAGMMVFFLFFGASNVARTILDEEQAGTLPRLFTTPTNRRVILGGKYASVFVIVTVQAVILLVAGRLIFGIDWGRIDAIVALTIAAAAVASSLALCIISLVRTPAQAGAISAGVYLILALLGGNFVGTSAVEGTYATIQKATPNGWLLRGWDAVMRGGGLEDIGLNLLVPLAFAVGFFAVALLRFRQRYA